MSCALLEFLTSSHITSALQDPEGFRVKASEGKDVVLLLRTLSNTESEVLRLSRRVNNMVKSIPSFGFTYGVFQK